MYKVYFEDVLFASLSTIENACSLALAVHSSSNVPHFIQIKDENDVRVIRFDRLDEVKK